MTYPTSKQLPVYEYSPQGFEELKSKLLQVESLREEAVVDLSKARDMGDLSENGYYKAARARLSGIDRDIRRYKIQIKYAKVIEKSTEGVVNFGSTITVALQDKQYTFTIVGKEESDPLKGKISKESPIGRALLSKRVGDTIQVEIPAGKAEYTVLEIS